MTTHEPMDQFAKDWHTAHAAGIALQQKENPTTEIRWFLPLFLIIYWKAGTIHLAWNAHNLIVRAWPMFVGFHYPSRSASA